MVSSSVWEEQVEGDGVGLDGVDGGRARVRKPYTITKSRESWTEPEHDKFLEALLLFDRDWRKIEAFVGSKTVIQIRSHAQKYFLKVQKNGTGEHLPPPRPKRKASHPYPHKASKRAPKVFLPQQDSPIMEQGSAIPMDACTDATNSSANDAFPSWDNALAQQFSARHTQGATNNCSSSIESQSGTWLTSEVIEQEIVLPALRAMPDFAQVYNFLGSIFDPETSGHLQRLREMDPIDAETVMLLMKNLSLNLSSPNFEAHRRLLSSHGPSMDQVKRESLGDNGNEQMRKDHYDQHTRGIGGVPLRAEREVAAIFCSVSLMFVHLFWKRLMFVHSSGLTLG